MLIEPLFSANNLGACEFVLSVYTADASWALHYWNRQRYGQQNIIAAILINMADIYVAVLLGSAYKIIKSSHTS